MHLSARLRYQSALGALALALSMPGIASAANYAGAWTFRGAMGNPAVETIAPVCVFRQVGNTLSGSCQGPAGIGSVTGGGVNGVRMTFRWNRIATSAAQRNGIITFFGTLGPANVIRGTWTDSYRPGGVGSFVAQRR
jgi:hypothetical protein